MVSISYSSDDSAKINGPTVPSVASLYESWSYLTEPKQAAEGADKVLVKRQYYYIPGPPPPPPPPVTYYAPSPPSQPAAPAPPPPPPSPRGSGSEENHS